MRRAAARRARGFSLLELVIVIVLVSVLVTLAVDRLVVLKAQAERVAMEQVIGNIRSGLTIRLAELLVRGNLNDGRLSGTNPMLLLAVRPDNYLGELFGPDPAALEPGHWYFDSRDGTLCYLVESVEYFQTALVPPRTRFKIQPVYEDTNRNGRYDPGTDDLRGMQLAPMEPYVWDTRFAWPDWPWSAPRTARRGGAG